MEDIRKRSRTGPASEIEARLGLPESIGRDAGDIISEYAIGDSESPTQTLFLAIQPASRSLTYVVTTVSYWNPNRF